MIETDREIVNKIDGLNYQLQQVETKIKIKKILTSNVANYILAFLLRAYLIISLTLIFWDCSSYLIFCLK